MLYLLFLKKAAKFESVVCCKLSVAFLWVTIGLYLQNMNTNLIRDRKTWSLDILYVLPPSLLKLWPGATKCPFSSNDKFNTGLLRENMKNRHV